MIVQSFERIAQTIAERVLAPECHGATVIVPVTMKKWPLTIALGWIAHRHVEIETQAGEPNAVDLLLDHLDPACHFLGVNVNSHGYFSLLPAAAGVVGSVMALTFQPQWRGECQTDYYHESDCGI
jgi:hypothetical protein